jgi:membrane protein DedA with SNARE-associated domain
MMHLLALLKINFNTIEGWLTAGGYFVLFGLLFACGLGLPLPEDIPLIIAGAFVANGKFHLAIASVVAWCGIIGGDVVLYHLGKKFGLEVTRLPLVGKHLTRSRIERIEQLFDRYGIWVVAVGRMVAGVRGAMVVAAGAARFNLLHFIIADGLAAIVSGGLFVALGYWLGSNLDTLITHVNKVKDWLMIGLIVAVIAVIAFIIWRKRSAKKIIDAVDQEPHREEKDRENKDQNRHTLV